MKQNRRNGHPVYRQIQNSILSRIERGELRSGDSVESERELARIHGVSLMTARHALAGLAREGVLQRRYGAGTFVAPPKIHFNKLMSYTEQMSARGMSAQSRVTNATIVRDQEIAARLGRPVTAKLVKIERVRLAADEPFALETCYLSADDFPHLTVAKLERGSLFATLERDYDVEISYADEEIDATGADHRSAELLEVLTGFPLLRIRQLIYSKKGKAIIYVFGLYRSERHTLLIRRHR